MDKSRLISNRKSDGIFLSSQIENEKEYVLEEQIMMKLFHGFFAASIAFPH